jgi:hypothetical protein
VVGVTSRYGKATTKLRAEHLLEHLTERLRQGGTPHPDVAAAVLAARGRTRLGQADFAKTNGLDATELGRAEDGDVPHSQLSVGLRRLIETA